MYRTSLVTMFVVAVFATSPAPADVVSLTIGNSNDPAFGHDLSVMPNGSSSSESTKAGPYPYSIVNVPSNAPSPLIPNGSYLGFCIALTENINYGQNAQFTVTSLKGDLEGETPQNKAGADIQANNILALLNDYGTVADPLNPSKGKYSDALTIAIWAVVDSLKSDGTPWNANGALYVNGANDPNPVSGNIKVSWDYSSDPVAGSAVKLANTWLSTLSSTQDDSNSNGNSQFAGANVYALENADEVQDQSLVIAFGDNHHTVPEPTGVASLSGLSLMGLLAGGCFAFRRRCCRSQN